MKYLSATVSLLLLLAGGLDLQAKPKKKEGTKDPEANFEELWQTFHKRYAFFELREVDWKKQYETFRPHTTTDGQLPQMEEMKETRVSFILGMGSGYGLLAPPGSRWRK